jgi:hypothetical protein
MFAHSDIYLRLYLLLIIIHITCNLLSLCRTSAPIHRERKLFGRQKSAGEIPSRRGEIVAIVIVIELDFIEIIIFITIITIITMPSRCNILG